MIVRRGSWELCISCIFIISFFLCWELESHTMFSGSICAQYWSPAPNESTADILSRIISHWAINLSCQKRDVGMWPLTSLPRGARFWLSYIPFPLHSCLMLLFHILSCLSSLISYMVADGDNLCEVKMSRCRVGLMVTDEKDNVSVSVHWPDLSPLSSLLLLLYSWSSRLTHRVIADN